MRDDMQKGSKCSGITKQIEAFHIHHLEISS